MSYFGPEFDALAAKWPTVAYPHDTFKTSPYNPVSWDTAFWRFFDHSVIGKQNYNFPPSNDNTGNGNRDNRFFEDWAKYLPIQDRTGMQEGTSPLGTWTKYLYPFEAEKNASIYEQVTFLRKAWFLPYVLCVLYVIMVFAGP